jgi:acyl-CoA dehydrogenase
MPARQQEGKGMYQLMATCPTSACSSPSAASPRWKARSPRRSSTSRNARLRPAGRADPEHRFKLAECATNTRVARVFVDDCIQKLLAGKLDTETASMAKYWVTDMQQKVIDECQQLHGGYGYMNEYLVCRMFADSRVQRIYGGTNEIMKELIP